MFARDSLLLSIFWLTIPFSAVLGEDMISETQKLTYPFASDSRFQLSNQNGSVQIIGDDVNEVRIEATKKALSIRVSCDQNLGRTKGEGSCDKDDLGQHFSPPDR